MKYKSSMKESKWLDLIKDHMSICPYKRTCQDIEPMDSGDIIERCCYGRHVKCQIYEIYRADDDERI